MKIHNTIMTLKAFNIIITIAASVIVYFVITMGYMPVLAEDEMQISKDTIVLLQGILAAVDIFAIALSSAMMLNDHYIKP